MTELSHPLRTPADVVTAGEQSVIIPPGDGDVVVLNDSGRSVLEQCDGTRSVEELAAAIAGDTGADVATVHSDLVSFLGRLRQTGAIIDANGRQVDQGSQ